MPSGCAAGKDVVVVRQAEVVAELVVERAATAVLGLDRVVGDAEPLLPIWLPPSGFAGRTLPVPGNVFQRCDQMASWP